jgi:TonB family protein
MESSTYFNIGRFRLRGVVNNPVCRFLSAVALACVVNFCLFLVLPVFQDFLGRSGKHTNGDLIAHEITPVAIQPHEPEKKNQAKRMRNIIPDRGRASTDGSGREMRFSPDLGVAGAGGNSVGMETQELAAVIFEEGQTDENIVPVRVAPVPYPERARELGIEGVLLIEVVIGTNGRVESVDVIKSPHPSIAAAAKKAASEWVFKPARNKGIPVRVRARKEIEFRLD